MSACEWNVPRSLRYRLTAKRPERKTRSKGRARSPLGLTKLDTQAFAPLLILIALAVAFLYLHFSGGDGRTRLYLAGILTVVAIIILLPSLNLSLPGWISAIIGGTRIQMGL